MEPQQGYQPQHEDNNNNSSSGGGNGTSSKSNFLCRQSSTRWIPTTDQIRILRDLYYNSGVRSPSAEQIQRISSKLRQYGKIEGKNVFYWFQNHKARERQKKRLTVDIASTKYTPTGVSSTCTSPGMYAIGHMGSSGCGGSLLMERSYKECGLTTGGVGGSMVDSCSNMGSWVGVEMAPPVYYHHQQWPTTAYNCYFDGQQLNQQEQEAEAEAAVEASYPEIETLPLFPIKQEEEEDYEQQQQQEQEQEQYCVNGFTHLNSNSSSSNGYLEASHYLYSSTNPPHANYYNSPASLELTLNSYGPPGYT